MIIQASKLNLPNLESPPQPFLATSKPAALAILRFAAAGGTTSPPFYSFIASPVAIYIGPGKRSMGPNTNAIHLCTIRHPLRHPGEPNIDPCNTIFSSGHTISQLPANAITESRTPSPQPHTQQEATARPTFKDLNSKEKNLWHDVFIPHRFRSFGTRRGASRQHPFG